MDPMEMACPRHNWTWGFDQIRCSWNASTIGGAILAAFGCCLACHNKTCHFSCDCRELAYRLCHYVLWKMISSTSFGWPLFFFRCPKSFCVVNVWPYHDIDNTYYHFEAYSKTDFNTSPHSAGLATFSAKWIHDDHGLHDRCSSYNNFSRLQNVIRKQSPRCCQGEDSFGVSSCKESTRNQALTRFYWIGPKQCSISQYDQCESLWHHTSKLWFRTLWMESDGFCGHSLWKEHLICSLQENMLYSLYVVDGYLRNPKQQPGMYKAPKIMG